MLKEVQEENRHSKHAREIQGEALHVGLAEPLLAQGWSPGSMADANGKTPPRPDSLTQRLGLPIAIPIAARAHHAESCPPAQSTQKGATARVGVRRYQSVHGKCRQCGTETHQQAPGPENLVGIPALTLTRWKILDKVANLLRPQFTYL